MSYPSIRGIDPDQLSLAEQEDALWGAFHTDLPLGMEALRDIADTVKANSGRTVRIEDPSSPLGQQLIRLLGTNVAHRIVESRLGISFGLYNCCGVVAAPTEDQLNMTLAEQIRMQNGELASANC